VRRCDWSRVWHRRLRRSGVRSDDRWRPPRNVALRFCNTRRVVQCRVRTAGLGARLRRTECLTATIAPTSTTTSSRAAPAALAALAFGARALFAALAITGRLALTALLGWSLIRPRLLGRFDALRLDLRLSLWLSLTLRLAIGPSITLPAAL
jgi:hypothetical protein